jgi:hypothetical protein
MGWMAGAQLLTEARDFSLLHSAQDSSGAHPASYTMSTRGSYPGAKWLGHKADHSPPSSVEAKNGGAIPPHPCLHGTVLN